MVSINLSATGAKEAVARLRKFLAANGVSLKQTHAYEALAQTLGYANWNTLQALLKVPPSTDDGANPIAAGLAADRLMAIPDKVLQEVLDAKERLRKAKISPSLEQSMRRAIDYATERHHENATLEHLLLSLIDDQDAAPVFLACDIDLDKLRKELTSYIDSNKLANLVTTVPGAAKPTSAVQIVVRNAILHNSKVGRAETTGADVIVALIAGEHGSHAVNVLKRQGMSKFDAENFVAKGRGKPPNDRQSG